MKPSPYSCPTCIIKHRFEISRLALAKLRSAEVHLAAQPNSEFWQSVVDRLSDWRKAFQ